MVNKVCKFAMLMLCFNCMCGCENNGEIIKDKLFNDDVDSSYEEYFLPMDYDFNNASIDGYVIYNNDKTIINEEKINDFYNKSLNNEESTLYIIRYTIEGDPVVSTYVYNNGDYMLYLDDRRDEFTANDDIVVKKIKRIELSKDEYGRTTIIQKY